MPATGRRRIAPAALWRARIGLIAARRVGIGVAALAGVAVAPAGRSRAAGWPARVGGRARGLAAGGRVAAGGGRVGLGRAGVAVRRARVGLATGVALPRARVAPGGPVGAAVLRRSPTPREVRAGQRVVIGPGRCGLGGGGQERGRAGRGGAGRGRVIRGRVGGGLAAAADRESFGGHGRGPLGQAGASGVGVRAIRPPGCALAARRPRGALGSVGSVGRLAAPGWAVRLGVRPGLGPGRGATGGRGRSCGPGRLSCRRGAGLGRAGRGRERVVGGQFGPVLLVGELVPLRARPVIVIVVMAAARRPPASLGLVLRPGRLGLRLRDLRPHPGEHVRIRQIRVGGDARGREVRGGRAGVVEGVPGPGVRPHRPAARRGGGTGRPGAHGRGRLGCVLVAPVAAGGRDALSALVVAAAGGTLAIAARRRLVSSRLVEARRLITPPRAAVSAGLACGPARRRGRAGGGLAGHPRVGAQASVTAPAAQPVPDGLAPAWLVFIIATASGQENPAHDRDDNGDEADHEQIHRTTQQAMAVWAAPARPTRPSRGPSPVSLAPRIHPRLSYWSVSLADRMGGVMRLGIFLPSPFTHCHRVITDWRLLAVCHGR